MRGLQSQLTIAAHAHELGDNHKDEDRDDEVGASGPHRDARDVTRPLRPWLFRIVGGHLPKPFPPAKFSTRMVVVVAGPVSVVDSFPGPDLSRCEA